MSNLELKAIASNFYESYNRRDLEKTFRDFIAPDIVNHTMGGCMNRDTWLHFEQAFLDACPDLSLVVKEQFVEGNRVVTHWNCSGTHQHAFFGMKPTFKTICLSCVAIDGIEKGKIKDHLAMADFTRFMRQFEAD